MKGYERLYGKDNSFSLMGNWKFELFDSIGHLKEVQEVENVVCTNGKEFLASFLSSAAAGASTFTCKYIAIGSDATAEVAANTTLGTELARTTGVASYVSNQIYQVKATFVSGSGTGNIVEFGIFSSSTAGTMLNRGTRTAIAKGASDTLTVTCQLTIA